MWCESAGRVQARVHTSHIFAERFAGAVFIHARYNQCCFLELEAIPRLHTLGICIDLRFVCVDVCVCKCACVFDDNEFLQEIMLVQHVMRNSPKNVCTTAKDIPIH